MKNNIKSTELQVLVPSACILGESSAWNSSRKSCFWVDIENHLIYEYKWLDKSLRKYDLGCRVSLVVESTEENEVIVGIQGGVGRFNLEKETLTIISDLDADWQTHRCNDGICDPKGRLWLSTMELNYKEDAGAVYVITDAGKIEIRISKATIPNGMAWSADHKYLYYIDSPTGSVRAYLYDEESAAIQFDRIVVQIPEHKGVPDGMTIDEEGMLWIALWGGYGVGRFDVNSGNMVDFIDVPAPRVSSCAFVGENLDQMIITTARSGMTEKELADFPESGNTFIIEPGVRGIADHICAL